MRRFAIFSALFVAAVQLMFPAFSFAAGGSDGGGDLAGHDILDFVEDSGLKSIDPLQMSVVKDGVLPELERISKFSPILALELYQGFGDKDWFFDSHALSLRGNESIIDDGSEKRLAYQDQSHVRIDEKLFKDPSLSDAVRVHLIVHELVRNLAIRGAIQSGRQVSERQIRLVTRGLFEAKDSDSMRGWIYEAQMHELFFPSNETVWGEFPGETAKGLADSVKAVRELYPLICNQSLATLQRKLTGTWYSHSEADQFDSDIGGWARGVTPAYLSLIDFKNPSSIHKAEDVAYDLKDLSELFEMAPSRAKAEKAQKACPALKEIIDHAAAKARSSGDGGTPSQAIAAVDAAEAFGQALLTTGSNHPNSAAVTEIQNKSVAASYGTSTTFVPCAGCAAGAK